MLLQYILFNVCPASNDYHYLLTKFLTKAKYLHMYNISQQEECYLNMVWMIAIYLKYYNFFLLTGTNLDNLCQNFHFCNNLWCVFEIQHNGMFHFLAHDICKHLQFFLFYLDWCNQIKIISPRLSLFLYYYCHTHFTVWNLSSTFINNLVLANNLQQQ